MKSRPKEKETPAAVLGTRYKCYKCGTKFYDLEKPKPLCPSCGVNQNDDEAKGIHKRKKKKRPYPMIKADPTIIAPQEKDDVIEVVNEIDAEYTLDVDDMVLEESTDTDNSK
jgi:hypothetical protein